MTAGKMEGSTGFGNLKRPFQGWVWATSRQDLPWPTWTRPKIGTSGPDMYHEDWGSGRGVGGVQLGPGSLAGCTLWATLPSTIPPTFPATLVSFFRAVGGSKLPAFFACPTNSNDSSNMARGTGGVCPHPHWGSKLLLPIWDPNFQAPSIATLPATVPATLPAILIDFFSLRILLVLEVVVFLLFSPLGRVVFTFFFLWEEVNPRLRFAPF